MRSLFYDIHRTVRNAVERSEYSILSALRILGISRSWYYSQISFSPLLDGMFNPMAIRNDDEWIVIGFNHQHPVMSFREIACTLIDEDLAYPFPSTVYNILKRHDLGTHKTGAFKDTGRKTTDRHCVHKNTGKVLLPHHFHR